MIDIKNVSKWYGTFQVLTDNTTSIKKGEEIGRASCRERVLVAV